jgi:hypothetical protein
MGMGVVVSWEWSWGWPQPQVSHMVGYLDGDKFQFVPAAQFALAGAAGGAL